jgi:hypothetical protein
MRKGYLFGAGIVTAVVGLALLVGCNEPQKRIRGEPQYICVPGKDGSFYMMEEDAIQDFIREEWEEE